MLDQLSQRLQQSLGVGGMLTDLMGFGGQKSQKTLTETDLDAALRDIRRALLEADVNLRAIQTFLTRIREEAVGQDILKGLNPEQQLVDIVHKAMITLLGEEQRPLSVLKTSQTGDLGVILLFGLQGSGKTTTAAKLALWLYQQHQKRVLLVAADTVRPAAIDQLIQLGDRAQKQTTPASDSDRPNLAVHAVPGESDMQAIVASGFERARAEGFDVLLIDTAGRQQIDTAVMAQLVILERSLQAKGWIQPENPLEKLLVLDAMMGQEAVGVGEAFDAQIGLTGLVMTKLDGDARGGAMLSVVEATGRPIKLIGTGEGLDGLEAFYPDRMASRILGMGDVLTLVEKAQQAVSEEDTLGMLEKFQSGAFNFNDFLKIQKQLKSLGSMAGILNMLPIPGLTKDMKTMMGEASQSQEKTFQTLYNSMTKAERAKPELINPSRIRRLAKGCGMSEKDVQAQITQFNQMRMMMQQMGKLFGGGGGIPDLMSPSAAPLMTKPSSGGLGLQMPRSQKPGKQGKSKLSKQEAMLQQMLQGKKPPKLPPGFPF